MYVFRSSTMLQSYQGINATVGEEKRVANVTTKLQCQSCAFRGHLEQ